MSFSDIFFYDKSIRVTCLIVSDSQNYVLILSLFHLKRYRANIYPCPESASEREATMEGVVARLADISTVCIPIPKHITCKIYYKQYLNYIMFCGFVIFSLCCTDLTCQCLVFMFLLVYFYFQVIDKSQEQRTRLLAKIAKNVHVWRIKVTKIKAIYHTMNMFRTERTHFIVEGWYPSDQHVNLQRALQKASVSTCTSSFFFLLHLQHAYYSLAFDLFPTVIYLSNFDVVKQTGCHILVVYISLT